MSAAPLVALLLSMAAPAAAQLTARQVMERVHDRAYAASLRYEGQLSITHSGGGREEKTWRYARIGPSSGARSMLTFLDPVEIRGVKLLLWNQPGKTANMWLYTPATARQRRIPSQEKRSQFAGTDFTYEDLEAQDSSRWDYANLEENAEEAGEACWRLTARRNSGRDENTQSLIWVSKEKETPLRVDYMKDGRVTRRIRMGGLELIQGIWTATEVTVVDEEAGSTTVLRLRDVRYGEPMPESDFTLEAMKDGW